MKSAFAAACFVSLVAAAANAAPPPGDFLFGGARMGMTKDQLLALPPVVAATPDCAKLIIAGEPRGTHLEVCYVNLPSPVGGAGVLRARYVMAPDQEGVVRLIGMSVRAEAAAAPKVMDELKSRFGEPSGTSERKTNSGEDRQMTFWSRAGQQVVHKTPCEGEGSFCIDYSDRAFARRLTRALGDV